jgi:predicted nuclease of predicted toxin-antitoxin system
MRLLADENVDRPIVTWLREQGHDVTEMVASAPGTSDSAVIDRSRSEERVLLTFDRDIGGLILFDDRPHPGVVYLRLQGAGPALWKAFREVWPRVATVALGCFVTVRNDQIVVRPLPPAR